MSNSALATLTAQYTDSENEGNLSPESDNSQSSAVIIPSSKNTPLTTPEQYKTNDFDNTNNNKDNKESKYKYRKRLVSYHDDTLITDNDDSSDDGESVNSNNDDIINIDEDMRNNNNNNNANDEDGYADDDEDDDDDDNDGENGNDYKYKILKKKTYAQCQATQSSGDDSKEAIAICNNNNQENNGKLDENNDNNMNISDIDSKSNNEMIRNKKYAKYSHYGFSLPPEPKGKPLADLSEKVRQLYEKMETNSMDMNDVIQQRKDFRNPSIYEKLIQFCNINEFGTNYPPAIYDPLQWGPESFYEELDRVQCTEMAKRHKDRKDKDKIEQVSALARKVEKEAKKRKSKWDQPASVKSSLRSTLTTTVTGTKGTVISAFGTLPKKPT